MVKLPPLSLYIHIPWCVQKCPYCDFNSHALKGEVPHDDYVQHLLNDLDNDVAYAQGREVQTIFIGGGTPSLLSGPAMQTLLDGVRARLPLAADAEITMEANPGTVEADRFVDYQRAGVNRISIGVQSFSEEKLKRLGRIHGPQEAKRAAKLASGLGLRSFNLDLMHGLPDQSLEEALGDLRQAIELNPPHLSWYQLTIEPNTLFGSRPPVLPDDDALWDIFAFDEDYDGPDLELAYTKVTLSADKGELEIEVTAGSESYSVESGSKSIVSASVSGNKIKLKAEKVGSAKVTVTDKKSGDKKTIEVEVMSKEDFHSAILGVGVWRLIDGAYSDDGGSINRPRPDGIG